MFEGGEKIAIVLNDKSLQNDRMERSAPVRQVRACTHTQTYIIVMFILYVIGFVTSYRLADGGVCVGTVCRGNELCLCGGPHSWLVPAMLSPPESLLIACIRRGNYIEAQQVRKK